MPGLVGRTLGLAWYGFAQTGSGGLRAYSILVALWTCFWGLLIGWATVATAPADMSLPGRMFIGATVWVIMMAMFCGLPWLIQLYWARKAVRASQQQRHAHDVEIEKRLLQEQAGQNGQYLPGPTPSAIEQAGPAGQYPTALHPAYRAVPPLAEHGHPEAGRPPKMHDVLAGASGGTIQRGAPPARREAGTGIMRVPPRLEEDGGPGGEVDRANAAGGISEIDRLDRIRAARDCELRLRYIDAAKIYDECGMPEEARRARTRAGELEAPR